MTIKQKIGIAALVSVLLISAGVYFFIVRNRGIVTVQSGRVLRQDLTQNVTANGEIKPKKFVNISSNAMGRIVDLPVKEGDHVEEGDLLLRLDSVQTEAEVSAAEANLSAAEAEVEGMAASERSFAAAINTARAEVTRAEVELTRTQQNFTRAERLNADGLISREQFDRSQIELDVAKAQLSSARARLLQTEAQAAQTQKQREGLALRLSQQRAALVRARDQFAKTTITAPLEGVITNLPVNVGEIAIVGVQNQPGTVLMTIADMSVITAEVAVDETDIVNVRLGQPAEVRVDALGDQILKGHVSEIGNSALTRTGGITTTTAANAQAEAKDFKVVITLDSPPSTLRPGFSCTATIVTATRSRVLTIPIQALTVREISDPETNSGDQGASKKIEQEGVFVIRNGTTMFRPVTTGIIGATDVEIVRGVEEGDEIVTGTYQVLRTLKDDTKIKIENQP